MVLFYGVNFTVRPWRVLQMARNLVARRQESLLDRAMGDFLRRAVARLRRSPRLPGSLNGLPATTAARTRRAA
jgi:hypothetical protein